MSEEIFIDNNETESVWCRIGHSDRSSFVVGAFYRPPVFEPRVMRQLRKIACRFSKDSVVLPGDCNFNAVVANVSKATIKRETCKSRRIFIYNKANYDAISTQLENQFLSFKCSADETSVDQLWLIFKERITCLIQRHVLSVSSSKKLVQEALD